jgi:hypothetical protein
MKRSDRQAEFDSRDRRHVQGAPDVGAARRRSSAVRGMRRYRGQSEPSRRVRPCGGGRGGPFNSSFAAAEPFYLYSLRPGGEAGGCSPAATGKGPGWGRGHQWGGEPTRSGPGERWRRGGDLSRLAPEAAGKSGRRAQGAPAAPAGGARRSSPHDPPRAAAARAAQHVQREDPLHQGRLRQPSRPGSGRRPLGGDRPQTPPAGPPSWSTRARPWGIICADAAAWGTRRPWKRSR